ncbi:MAG: serine protease Do [Thermoanaerobaculia bacterium]|nr:serine protease Do [Thermoanaerobaculia bacterium]
MRKLILLAYVAAAATAAAEPSWQKIREASKPSIVFLDVVAEYANGATNHEFGTGFIISPEGHVLTCHHLLPDEKPQKLTIKGRVGDRTSEQQYELTVERADPDHDLLLLKIASARKWQPLRVCTTAAVKDDDPVYAIGFPYEENITGVSGPIINTTAAGDHWRTSAPVNHGMSGGPVFDTQGRVIALVRAGREEAQSLADLIPLRLAFSLLGVAGVDPCPPAPTATVDVRSISAIPTGVDWPVPALNALEALEQSPLSDGDKRYLVDTYTKGVERLYLILKIPTELLDNALRAEMENVTKVVYMIQKVVGFQLDWCDVYAALKEKRPQMFSRLNIPAPADPAGTTIDVNPLTIVPVPARISFDVHGPGSLLIRTPPLTSGSDGAEATDFIIHARTEHDAAAGSSVKVWITPGMAEGDAAIEACGDATCSGDEPNRHVLEKLFTRALNRALIRNLHGFGQYFVTSCGEHPKTNEYGWLNFAARVAVNMDPRYSYTITNYDWTHHRAGTPTDYDLGFDQFGEGYSARFFPMRDDVIGLEALQYVWGLCAAQKLESMVFVTKLRHFELNEATGAPNASRF